MKEGEEMRLNRYLPYAALAMVIGVLFLGCRPRLDTMAKAEKIFIKMVDKTARKLDLNEEQKIQLEELKLGIRKNFKEGRAERDAALTSIKGEGKKESPEIREMTSHLQGMLRDETERVNHAFDLMLDFQDNLNEGQKEKLTKMITDWVAKWD
jgi:rubrerythrin